MEVNKNQCPESNTQVFIFDCRRTLHSWATQTQKTKTVEKFVCMQSFQIFKKTFQNVSKKKTLQSNSATSGSLVNKFLKWPWLATNSLCSDGTLPSKASLWLIIYCMKSVETHICLESRKWVHTARACGMFWKMVATNVNYMCSMYESIACKPMVTSLCFIMYSFLGGLLLPKHLATFGNSFSTTRSLT